MARSLIGSQSWIFDATYTPLETDFSKIVIEPKIQIISEIELLLHQSIDAFGFWINQTIDETLVRKEVLKILILSFKANI
jgi:shikimate 5-dehydrogenase